MSDNIPMDDVRLCSVSDIDDTDDEAETFESLLMFSFWSVFDDTHIMFILFSLRLKGSKQCVELLEEVQICSHQSASYAVFFFSEQLNISRRSYSQS